MPTLTLPLAEARSLAQRLTDPASQQHLLQSVATAEAAGEPTVQVGWISGASAVQLEQFLGAMRSDTFQTAGSPAQRQGTLSNAQWAAWVSSPKPAKPAPAELKESIAQGEARLKAGDATKAERGKLYLATSSLRMKLVQAGENLRANAIQSFKDLKAAVECAPADLQIDLAHAHTIYALTSLGWIMRKATELGLGVNLSAESRDAMRLLAKHPEDAAAQVGRQLLARVVGDSSEEAATQVTLAALSPAAVAAARKEFEQSKAQASSATKDRNLDH